MTTDHRDVFTPIMRATHPEPDLPAMPPPTPADLVSGGFPEGSAAMTDAALAAAFSVPSADPTAPSAAPSALEVADAELAELAGPDAALTDLTDPWTPFSDPRAGDELFAPPLPALPDPGALAASAAPPSPDERVDLELLVSAPPSPAERIDLELLVPLSSAPPSPAERVDLDLLAIAPTPVGAGEAPAEKPAPAPAMDVARETLALERFTRSWFFQERWAGNPDVDAALWFALVTHGSHDPEPLARFLAAAAPVTEDPLLAEAFETAAQRLRSGATWALLAISSRLADRDAAAVAAIMAAGASGSEAALGEADAEKWEDTHCIAVADALAGFVSRYYGTQSAPISEEQRSAFRQAIVELRRRGAAPVPGVR